MNKEYYPLYIVIPVYALGIILTGFIGRHLYTITGSVFWSVVITSALIGVLFFVTLLAIMSGIK